MKLILFVLGFFLAKVSFAAPAERSLFDPAPTRARVEARLMAGDTAALADEALDAAIAHAETVLRRKGHVIMARDLHKEWNQDGWHGYLQRLGLKDMGDHDPMLQWLADWYAKIEGALGVAMCETTHIRDLWVMNYGLKVTMNPHEDSQWCKEEMAAHPDSTCIWEYERHNAGTRWVTIPDPFANETLHHGVFGVISYWLVFAGCEAALWGTDGTFLCGPIGSGAEFLTERYIAPKASDGIWERANIR